VTTDRSEGRTDGREGGCRRSAESYISQVVVSIFRLQ